MSDEKVLAICGFVACELLAMVSIEIFVYDVLSLRSGERVRVLEISATNRIESTMPANRK